VGELISVAAGLFGTVLGAAIAWLVSQRQQRLAATFSMHREFHDPEMTRSRNLGGKTVREHSSKDFDAMRRQLSPEETQHIWNVMYFYQRLHLAIKYKNIVTRFVPEMFGENFTWWYLKSYGHQLAPLNWEAGHHIAELHEWLARNADQGQIARWRERAETMGDPILDASRPDEANPNPTA
jgi:hypothetical protein